MKNIVNSYVRRFRKEHRRSRRAVAILLALALLVSTGVTWQLHSTGIALTNETFCGQEEHTHTEECYGTVLSCGLAESEATEGHTHTEACYETQTVLVCGLEESEAHTHSDACYSSVLTCGLEESEGHTHTEACYDEDGNLICGQEEREGHTHDGSCYTLALTCGLEESEGHTHSDACYETVEVLICSLEECEATEGHTHTEACYETQLICGMEEHTHTIECLVDETADVETAADWEATIPDLTGIWAEDVVAIAESQLGYTESTANYTLADDGETHKGYTRYGAWYGNKYGDWCAMFASFCLHYAGVPESEFPEAAGVYAWIASLNNMGLYAEDCTPSAGDLVFFDNDSDGAADHVGIITEIDENAETITVIEGNCSDAVMRNTYSLSDSAITGFGLLPEQETEKAETKTYTAEADGVTVTVTAPVGALPEDAELTVTMLSEDSDEYAAAAEAVGYDVEDEDTGMAALDIAFYVGDEEVEPTEAVTVTIDASNLLPEEADAETIEVQHLAETEEGIAPVLVADATENTEGTVDAETVVAEFEVDGFSTFTISWGTISATGLTDVVSITATNYLLSAGTGSTPTSSTLSSEQSYETLSVALDDTVYLTDSNASLNISGYTLDYATVNYNNNSYVATALTVTRTSTGSGNNYTYTYTYVDSDGEEKTISGATSTSGVTISLYYVATPTITITASGSDSAGYTLTATTEETYTYTEYKWSVSDDSLATITQGSDGKTATVTWNTDTATTGKTVTVAVTGTYTDVYGETQTVTSTYDLTYNLTAYIISVTYGDNKTSVGEGVTVAFYDSEGNLAATGTTNSSGQITVNLKENETYTVVSSYTYKTEEQQKEGPSKVTIYAYQYSGSFTAGSDTTINLTETTSYEHIDIKDSVASATGESTTSIDTIVSIVITDAAGNVVYTSSGVPYSSDNSNWQGHFDGTHSIIFVDSYSVTITYTIKGDSTIYSATFDSSSTYAEGTYYPADGSNAYKLYNYIYGTSYTSNSSVNAPIDISGMSIYLVASILCDSSSVTAKETVGGSSQWGLDFALSVDTLIANGANFNLEVSKTYKNADMTNGQFTFYLYKATYDGNADTWSIDGDPLQTVTNSAATKNSDTNNSTTTIDFSAIAYGTSDTGTYYYIIYEANGGTTLNGTTYDGTVYGVKVEVTTSTSTVGTVTTTDTNVTKTYYTLTATTVDGVTTYKVNEATSGVTENTNGEAVFSFTNTYAETTTTGFTILKVDGATGTTTDGVTTYSKTLSGAVFTLTTSGTNTESGETTTTYYDKDGKSSTNETKLTTDTDDEISISGLANGTYTLTEVTAPDGYNLLSGTITLTVTDGSVQATYNGSDKNTATVTTTSDVITLTVTNTAGYELPSTGGMGTWLYTLAGVILCGGAALVLYRRKRLS